VDAETFLDHKITAVHQLNAPRELVDAVGEDIYTFTYNYRDDYKGDPAFVLVSVDALFMLVGAKAEFQMIGLAQAESIDEENPDEDEEESDELDFSMM
jgi:gamma-glutamyltranspeptidase